MRCKFCGSTALHPDTQHKTFSTGKAVAGAVVFGVVGAAAGLIGKDQNGFRCGACGAFVDAPMDSFTELQVNNAIRDAESGRDRALYDYYKAQYPNIQANIPPQVTGTARAAEPLPSAAPVLLPAPGDGDDIKRIYRYGLWQPDCPIFVESVILHAGEREDRLSLIAWNQSGKIIRSVYFRVRVLDDTGDEVGSVRCVYQGLAVPGDPDAGDDAMLPADKTFPLGTDLAYRVELTCEKVAFEEDEIWRQTEGADEISLPLQPMLTADNFPRIKYVQTRFAGLQKTRAAREREPYAPRFTMPVERDAFWLCCCGHPVKKDAACPYCRDRWESVEKAFSQNLLREIQQREVKERAAKRAAKTWPLYEAVAAEKARKEEAEKDASYTTAIRKQGEDTIASVREAESIFQSLKDYRDSGERAAACEKRVPELEEAKRRKDEEERIAAEKRAEEKRIAAEQAARKRKKTTVIVLSVVAVCIVGVLLITQVIIPHSNYNKAKALLDAGQYNEAIVAFEALNGYKDSTEKITAAKEAIAEAENAAAYEKAEALLAAGDYDGAEKAFSALGEYSDARQMVLNTQEARNNSQYQTAVELLSNGKYEEAYNAFVRLGEYSDSADQAKKAALLLAEKLMALGDIEFAVEWYKAGDEEDTAHSIEYNYIIDHYDNQDELTYKYLIDLSAIGYSDAKTLNRQLYGNGISITAFFNTDDYTWSGNQPQSLSRIPEGKGGPVLFYCFSGGHPGQSVRLKFYEEYHLDYRNSNTWEVVTEYHNNWGDEYDQFIEISVGEWYRHKVSSWTWGSNIDKVRITVYDADTGAKYGEYTVSTPTY